MKDTNFSPYSSPSVVWNENDLLEFAGGSIAKVFGPEYKVIDTYKRRVRLPLYPYFFVSRVTQLRAQRNVYRPSFIQTEYDIPTQAWYAVDGQIPWAVVVESGQCDLLLISYLGIDFKNKGERVYRLLGASLTFLTPTFPMEGQTLRYDISINSYAQDGNVFFFSYDCFIGHQRILEMRNGCAGFFTDEELAKGQGIILTEAEQLQRGQIQKKKITLPIENPKRSYSRQEILCACKGDLAGCFGPGYESQGKNKSLRLPPEKLLMVDRIVSIDPQGGAWGLGLVIAEKIIRPDDWYFECHFKDDHVLAGSLIGEGCGQLIQLFMLYAGLHLKMENGRFQPVPHSTQKVRCRGQTTPTDAIMTYRMEISDISLSPTPQVVADVDIIFKGKTIVDFKNLAIQIVES